MILAYCSTLPSHLEPEYEGESEEKLVIKERFPNKIVFDGLENENIIDIVISPVWAVAITSRGNIYQWSLLESWLGDDTYENAMFCKPRLPEDVRVKMVTTDNCCFYVLTTSGKVYKLDAFNSAKLVFDGDHHFDYLRMFSTLACAWIKESKDLLYHWTITLDAVEKLKLEKTDQSFFKLMNTNKDVVFEKLYLKDEVVVTKTE